MAVLVRRSANSPLMPGYSPTLSYSFNDVYGSGPTITDMIGFQNQARATGSTAGFGYYDQLGFFNQSYTAGRNTDPWVQRQQMMNSSLAGYYGSKGYYTPGTTAFNSLYKPSEAPTQPGYTYGYDALGHRVAQKTIDPVAKDFGGSYADYFAAVNRGQFNANAYSVPTGAVRAAGTLSPQQSQRKAVDETVAMLAERRLSAAYDAVSGGYATPQQYKDYGMKPPSSSYNWFQMDSTDRNSPFSNTRYDMLGNKTYISRSDPRHTAAAYQGRYGDLYNAYVGGAITGSQLFTGATRLSVLNDYDEINNSSFSYTKPPSTYIRFNSSGGGGIKSYVSW